MKVPQELPEQPEIIITEEDAKALAGSLADHFKPDMDKAQERAS